MWPTHAPRSPARTQWAAGQVGGPWGWGPGSTISLNPCTYTPWAPYCAVRRARGARRGLSWGGWQSYSPAARLTLLPPLPCPPVGAPPPGVGPSRRRVSAPATNACIRPKAAHTVPPSLGMSTGCRLPTRPLCAALLDADAPASGLTAWTARARTNPPPLGAPLTTYRRRHARLATVCTAINRPQGRPPLPRSMLEPCAAVAASYRVDY